MELKDYTVLDLETTINAPEPHFGASPAHPLNRIVWLGYQHGHSGEVVTTDDDAHIGSFIGKVLKEERMLIGHNIAFDLQYLLRQGMTPYTLDLWDTQKFHYIQSGRFDTYMSLTRLAEYWKIPFEKDEFVSEMFRAGFGADKINSEDLCYYLDQDVSITHKIFLKQIEYCEQKGERFFAYVRDMMNSIGVTCAMSSTGVAFDLQGATKMRDEKKLKLESMLEELVDKWGKHWPEGLEFNPKSPDQVATLLWGGETKQKAEEPVLDKDGEHVRYKSGKSKGELKYRAVDVTVKVNRLAKSETREEFLRESIELKSGIDVLKKVQEKEEETLASAFASDILTLRHFQKEISTYYDPYINFAVPFQLTEKVRIHPTYNHCGTATGRLSSNKPNMQNISGKD